MKILAIDDDLADLMRAILEEEGHQAVRATDGDKAMRLLAECRFDLVITDVFHPGPKGPEIARAALGRGMRTVLVTAAAIVDCPDGTVCAQKPALVNDLLALLGRTAGLSRVRPIPRSEAARRADR